MGFQLFDSIGSNAKCPIEVGGKFRETDCVIVENCNVARCLIGDMDFVALIRQPYQRAPHANDVVIRMRREDQNPFGKDIIVAPGVDRPAVLRDPVCPLASP